MFRLAGPLNLLRLMSLAELARPDLKFPPFTPVNVSPLQASQRVFDVLRAQDVLLHHPYDSFQPVVDFVEQAARDPAVFAMKQTLYRTSGDSPIVRALMEASRNGKQVTALVELKARFDEANNIQWARQLEEAGVHVVYGLLGHKTHCKCSLVVRLEGSIMRRYAHLGTGNYNPRTARLYTDLSYFTSRPEITEDVANLFNSLTGFSRSPSHAGQASGSSACQSFQVATSPVCSASKPCSFRPVPMHFGHQPCFELKENSRGSSSAKPVPQLGQARWVEYTSTAGTGASG